MNQYPSRTPAEERPRPRGIRASAREIVAHVRALALLERELAQKELQRKGTAVGVGTGLVVAAGVLVFYAVGVGLAAAAAALALVVDWWLALLIVFGALLLVVLVLVLVARSMFRKSTPLLPEQALEEARLTKEVLRGTRAG